MATPIQQFSNIVSRYQPGGEFSVESGVTVDKLRKQLANVNLKEQVSAGLGGREPATTTESRFMNNVGAGFKRNLEATRTGNLVNALLAKAGFLESEQGRKAGIRETKRALRFQSAPTIIGQTPDYAPMSLSPSYPAIPSGTGGITPGQWATRQAGGTSTPTTRIHDIPALNF